MCDKTWTKVIINLFVNLMVIFGTLLWLLNLIDMKLYFDSNVKSICSVPG